ncbi:chromosome-associated kinesin KIF4A-like isoform X1 [Macrosteles quadrilineatus]|uniref:chromosome-associated kinesin KIF4A-like isoform X1 n=1 Tax=Macrosteles quadrilineatus TaxID=74068 RepID=UPI0023E119F2|nr:chromosome-associated kinesin KIF4A-like isoform X1 [Macrosteles quadrilineatus]
MDSVQVAIRVRPLVPHELESGCRSCVEVIPEAQQIVTKMRNDKFTFNYVFDSSTPQIDIYETAVQNLVNQLFKGYNVTVLAYGQTGSGKTYSMGTCPSANPADQGIIQRAINDMFVKIENDDDWMFNVSVSFLELYNEQLIDLLSENKNSTVDLRESNRGIIIPGLTQKTALTAADVLQCLQQGSENRTTGATAMNAQSSRSHAIFTIYIRQTKRSDEDDAMSAKFHLVDLAGSERSKKTRAEGKRFIEGVNINKELFVLGNVISSLCDGSAFVNYRDSKLTRLLQDSLGGNALTLMLACVSPADSNLDETVNTLRYADRARKIKNKPVVNQDPQKQEINRLKQTIEELRLQIVSNQPGTSCPPEHSELIEKNKLFMEKNKKLGASLDRALMQTTSLLERTQIAEAARDRLTAILNNFNAAFNNTLSGIDSSLNDDQKTSIQSLKVLIDELKTENEKSETERIKFEEQLCAAETSLNESSHRADLSVTEEDDEGREEFVLELARKHHEIQELDKDLAWKEALAVKLAQSNSVEGTLLQATNVEDIMELKTQINNLLHEKEELEKQLNNQRSSSIDHKLAEQRRKRVKELEEKISALSKKVTDQDRIIRMKERNEEKMKTLSGEIMNLKQTKVKLINEMKSEGEKYRQLRASREREVCKLRQQNRQKETKFVKMESYYMKQQNVYKRKLEESTAVIRRLKDTLALQQRNAKDKKSLLGNAEKVSQWVNQEFSAMVNALEAEQTLENLKEDRALLSKELKRLKESISSPELDKEEKCKISEEIKSLNEDIELRSTQILDLTHKLQSLDSYQENKSKTRYECVQTMADAKTALRYVFDTAHSYLSELHKNKASKEAALQELRDSYEALQEQLMEKETMLKEEIENNSKKESNLNEKVTILLQRLKDMERESFIANNTRAPLEDLSNVVEEETEEQKRSTVSDKQLIKQLQQRVEELEKQQKKIPKKEKKTSEWNAAITPETRRKFFEEEDDEDLDLDDSSNDPDWRKTPVYHRLKSIRENIKDARGNAKEKVAVKRNINGQPCCNCKLDCQRKSCSCKKNNSLCTGLCSCDDAKCKNKEQYANMSSTMSPKNDSTSDDSNISFKKPRENTENSTIV